MMPLTFSQKTIENLIETINLYGMSVEKFKRTLQLILVENMFTNSYYFVHQICFSKDTPAYSESKFEKSALLLGQNGLIESFARGLKRYDTALQKPIKSDQHYSKKAEDIFDQVLEYSRKKKTWLKAFEILQEILVMKDEFNSEQEKNIYKFQLIINYLNQTSSQTKFQYILDQLRIVTVNVEDYVSKRIPQLLERRLEARQKKNEMKFG